MIIELLFASFAFGKDICIQGNCEGDSLEPQRIERKGIGSQPDLTNITQGTMIKKLESQSKTNITARKTIRVYHEPSGETNLPEYFQNLPANTEHNFVFTPKTEANDVLPGVNRGTRIKVVIKQSLKASPNLPTPVVGEVISDSMKGSYIYGEAILEGDLKRVTFKFSSLGGGRLLSHYLIKASGLDTQGRIGYEGDYHAEDWKYGIASFLSTGAAIAVDSQVDRSQTINGNYTEAPSASNAVKKGVAGSLGKVAERMAERAAQVPGFTEIEGPIYLTVVIEDKPKVSR